MYLDHNATTPLDPDVREAWGRWLRDTWGNPSSIHGEGRRARKLLGDAREQVAAALGADPRQIAFTSGGTESIDTAIAGAVSARRHRGGHVVTTAVEHSATRACLRRLARRDGVEVTEVPVDGAGWWRPDDVLAAVRDDTVLVTVMHANNETGALYDVASLVDGCRERGVAVHVDAVQSFGKVPFEFDALGVDLASVSGHKVYAPKGTGALVVRRGVRLPSLLRGGPQERGRRPGTEYVAGQAAFGMAADLAAGRAAAEAERLTPIRDAVEQGLLAAWPGARVNGAGVPRLANTTNICFPGLDAAEATSALDLLGVQVSTGAACSQADEGPSHVLLAMGMSAADASASLRLSLGAASRPGDVERVRDAFVRAAT